MPRQTKSEAASQPAAGKAKQNNSSNTGKGDNKNNGKKVKATAEPESKSNATKRSRGDSKEDKQKNQKRAATVAASDERAYASENYWDERYKDQEGYLEWYFGFEQLRPLVDDAVSAVSKSLGAIRVLESGCGDAPLLFGFRDAYRSEFNVEQLVGIDFADSIVKVLNEDKDKKNGEIQFRKMDGRRMDFADGSFNIVFDKGTVDALLCSDSGFDDVRKLVGEYCRVLPAGGHLVLVSHMGPDSSEFMEFMENCLSPALESWPERHWAIEAHTSSGDDDEEEEEEEEGPSPSASPTVYIVSSQPRRRTRVSDSARPVVSFQVHEY